MHGPLERPVLRVLFYSHFWLAFGAMAQVWWIGTFTDSVGPRQVVGIGASVIAAYGMMRIVRTFEEDLHPSPWILWVKHHRVGMIALVLITAAISFWALSGSQRVFKPWDLIAVFAVLLYLVPLRDSEGRSMGLRRIPLMKSPMIAAVWAVAATGTSNVTDAADQWITILPFATIQYGFFFAVALASDLVDMQHDEKELRTLPQMLGIRAARSLAVIGLAPGMVWMIILMCLYPGASGPDLRYLLPFIGYLVVALAIVQAGPERPRWYVPIILDGSLLLVPLLAFLAGAR